MISVIVPVYNIECYLKTCINLIINQTFKDFELILINDGSTDSSGTICNDFAQIDDRIKVVHKKNEGVSAARNAGLYLAKGDYIAFVDGDDEIENNYLEILYVNAKKYDADISCCGIVQVAQDKKVHTYCDNGFYNFDNAKKIITGFFDDRVVKEIFYGPYCKIIKAEIAKQVKFRRDIHIAEDILFNFECVEIAKNICVDNQGLYKYIKRINSVTTSRFNEKRLDYIKVADILFEKVCNNYEFARDVATKWVFEQKVNVCRLLYAHLNERAEYAAEFKKRLKECNDIKKKVWKFLSFKTKTSYVFLRSFPFVFKLIEK